MDAEELLGAIDRYVNSEKFRCRPAEEKECIVTYGIPLATSIFIGLKLLEAVQKQMELDKLNRELSMARLEKLWSIK